MCEITLAGKRFIVSPLFLLFFPFLVFASPYKKQRTIKLKGRTYNAYIADNFFAHAIGYMFRDPKDVAKNECMVFEFNSKGRHCFWMLETHFNIDLYSQSGRSAPKKECTMKAKSLENVCVEGSSFIEIKK